MTPQEFQSQFLPVANKSVETTLAASQIIFSMAEELQAVYFAASRQALSDALQGAQSVLSMQNPQDFAAAQSQLTQVSVSKLMATPQNILEISMRAASELGGLLNAQVSELNSAASDLVQKTTAFQQSLQPKTRR